MLCCVEWSKAVITPLDPTQLSWRRAAWSLLKLNWTKSHQFAVSREVLNMLRTLRLTGNGRFFVQLSW